MPIPHRRSAVWLWAVAGVSLLLVWFLPVEVSPTVHLPAKLVAGAEWTVERSGQGTVTARLEDRLRGVSDRYLVQSVDRGDVAELVLEPELRAGGRIEVGDTVAALRSAVTDARLAEVEGLVTVSASELAALEQGEKETLIEEARARLASIRTMIAVQERVVGRLRELADRGSAAQDELDRKLVELVALEGEADVVEAQIAVLQTGARPVDLQLAAARLDAARAQLDALAAQRQALVITTPLGDTLALPPGDSVLVRVIDMNRWAIIVPVPVEDRAAFSVGRVLTLDRYGTTATIKLLDASVQMVGGRSVVLAVAEGVGEVPDVLDHETVAVRIDREPIRLRVWFVEELRALFRWQNWFGHAERV